MTDHENDPVQGERLLTSDEVAAVFRVDRRTVCRWARIGRIASTKPGGQRLFPESEVRRLAAAERLGEFAEAA